MKEQIGVVLSQAKNTWSYKELEEARKGFPLEFRGNVALMAP